MLTRDFEILLKNILTIQVMQLAIYKFYGKWEVAKPTEIQVTLDCFIWRLSAEDTKQRTESKMPIYD